MFYLQLFFPELWIDSTDYLPLDETLVPSSQTFPCMMNSFSFKLTQPSAHTLYLHDYEPTSLWARLDSCLSKCRHHAVFILPSNLSHIYPLLILYCGTFSQNFMTSSRLLNNFLSPCFPLPGCFFLKTHVNYITAQSKTLHNSPEFLGWSQRSLAWHTKPFIFCLLLSYLAKSIASSSEKSVPSLFSGI